MGCDVHMYVEKYNDNTKSWEVVGKEFPDMYVVDEIIRFMEHHLGTSRKEAEGLIYKFLKGEKGKTKFERYVLNVFLPKEVPMEDNGLQWWQQEGKLAYPFTDQPYQGRNYQLFGALAGVRDPSMDTITDWDRGLPYDVSEEICNLSEEWGMDAHSHNHIYMNEILNSKYYKMTEKELNDLNLGTRFFKITVNNILHFVGGDPNKIRLVFWFDN